MTSPLRAAIENADVDALRALVAGDRALARVDVSSGEDGQYRLPPLHVACEAVFRRVATEAQALAMADVLLAAGVDPNQAYAKSGDTFLIAAASLGAELVGLRLVERGADVHARGLWRATALHWTAHMGLPALARALLGAGADLHATETQYACTPLEWALHAWTEGTNGARAEVPAVVRVLLERGAVVPPGALDGLGADGDAPLRAALAGL